MHRLIRESLGGISILNINRRADISHMSQLPAQHTMLFTTSIYHVNFLSFDWPVEPHLLCKLVSTARSMAIDVFPGSRVAERQLVRADADDLAVLLVQIEHIERQRSAHEPTTVGDTANGMADGAWEPMQRMKEDVVDGPSHVIQQDLEAGIIESRGVF